MKYLKIGTTSVNEEVLTLVMMLKKNWLLQLKRMGVSSIQHQQTLSELQDKATWNLRLL